jgi:hypothetical protein
VDDIGEEEHSLLRSNFGERPCLNPLRKLVNGDEQVGAAPACFLEGSNQVESLDHEWPHDRDRLECLSRQMRLPNIVLAPFTGAYNLHGVGYGSGPVEALLEGLLDEGPRSGVMSTCPSVDVL